MPEGQQVATDWSPNRFLKIDEVIARTSWSRSKIYEAIAAGEFPRQVRLSANRIAFAERDIEAWITAKAEAARDD